jgi:membrane protein YdbS with pleckstrin-like domain
MEIEEMQALWSDMSNQLEQQKKLTNEIIMNMTQERYSKKFQTVSIIESIGAVICFIGAGYILLNFEKLNSWIEISSGIITLSFYIVLPIIILRALRAVKKLNILEKNNKETLHEYLLKKKKLLMLQKYSIYACFVLMFAQLPVATKILLNKDFLEIPKSIESYIGLSLVLIIAIFYARWGYNYYVRLTNSAEKILKDLE